MSYPRKPLCGPPALLTHVTALLLALSLSACIPARVKQLNADGQKAFYDRKYDQAVALFGESLSIYPKQPKIRQQLQNAKTMLKQIYVYKIYELVDGKAAPVETYLQAWKMSSQLPELGVPKARVGSIRVDLDTRLRKSEARLHKSTEAHKYFHHLKQMSEVVPSTVVDKAQAKVADELLQTHLKERKAAEARKLPGLALLHTLAAATFAPGDTGLWADGSRRRQALLASLAIPLRLGVQSKSGARHGAYLFGGLRRKMPRIFKVSAGARLSLSLDADRPRLDERRLADKRSARCQVGTRRVPNPACPTLTRRAKAARKEVEARIRALDTARQRCAGVKAGRCTQYLSDAERELARTRKRYQGVERKASRCPAFLTKPIYRRFFYGRTTVTRNATVTARVTLTRGGKPWRGRAVTGAATARDVTGPGLSCARIPPDPLKLPALNALQVRAEGQLLHRALADLRQLRREKAKAQLAGRDDEASRLDALVRARLVDETYRDVARQLSAQLSGQWTTDFGLTKKVVR